MQARERNTEPCWQRDNMSVDSAASCDSGTCSNQDITAIEDLTLHPCVPMVVELVVPSIYYYYDV
jgi:hypothetical protein